MELIHCIYCSATTNADIGTEDLDELLAVCRKNNTKVGVTGMLLFNKGTFFQVLEGDRSTVEHLLNVISKDSRHTQVTKIILEPIDERDFGDWTMGYSRLGAKELAKIEGLNDFFKSGKSYLDLDEGRTKTLLRAFKEGQWRLSLS